MTGEAALQAVRAWVCASLGLPASDGTVRVGPSNGMVSATPYIVVTPVAVVGLSASERVFVLAASTKTYYSRSRVDYRIEGYGAGATAWLHTLAMLWLADASSTLALMNAGVQPSVASAVQNTSTVLDSQNVERASLTLTGYIALTDGASYAVVSADVLDITTISGNVERTDEIDLGA